MIARTVALANAARRFPVLLLFLALASAIIPALVPSGSPMVRVHGSAFDPTTSTVTLRIRNETLRVAAALSDDGRDTGPVHQPLFVATPPAEAAQAPRLYAAAPAAVPAAPRLASPRATSFRARAPPILT